MSGADIFVSFKDIAEVREITRRSRMAERRPMSASVMPSARYSCPGSPERFFRGNTAKDLIAGCFRAYHNSIAIVVHHESEADDCQYSPSRTATREELNLFSAGRTAEPELSGRVISIAGLMLDSAVDR